MAMSIGKAKYLMAIDGLLFSQAVKNGEMARSEAIHKINSLARSRAPYKNKNCIAALRLIGFNAGGFNKSLGFINYHHDFEATQLGRGTWETRPCRVCGHHQWYRLHNKAEKDGQINRDRSVSSDFGRIDYLSGDRNISPSRGSDTSTHSNDGVHPEASGITSLQES
jgi:hypothetical protein